MMALLLVYVVPDIVQVFVSRGADLPFLTRLLIGLERGSCRTIGLYAAARARRCWCCCFGRWARVPANRLRVAPVRSPSAARSARFSRQHNAARFAGSLATLVQSAVPLVEALHAAAAVTPNR